MKTGHWILLSVLAAAAAGCEGGGVSMIGGPSSTEGEDQYSILLHIAAGQNHMKDAQRYKDNTEQMAGWTGLFIVSKEGLSELYWGKYRTVQAAQGDLKRARGYVTKVGLSPYTGAIVKKIPGKDIGPPEWNLANVTPPGPIPPDDPGFRGYTVLIATFFDRPDADYFGRRNHAVDYCRQLREQNVEAYYFHGTSHSIVSVGLFGAAAVEKITKNAGTVVETLPKDPRIEQIRKQYPYMAENGYKKQIMVADVLTKKAQVTYKFSYLTPVPRKTKDEDAALYRSGNP
jgi:hypothetical protein